MRVAKWLALALAIAIVATGCSAGNTADGEQGKVSETPAGLDSEGFEGIESAEAVQQNPDTLLFDNGSGANDFESYMLMLDGMYRQGLYFQEKGLPLQAEFMYGAGLAAAGSLRYCTECVLFLKGEGESIDDVATGRFADWDMLARLSPVSPYPDYFEGVVYQIQGMSDLAEKYFSRAVVYPSWPEEGLDFSYLKMLETDELYSIRDALVSTEGAFFAEYTPSLITIERDPLNFHAEYLLAKASEALADGDSGLALAYAKTAVAADPFSGDAFAGAALLCADNGDAEGFADYINGGLVIDPAHEGLKLLLEVYGEEDGQ